MYLLQLSAFLFSIFPHIKLTRHSVRRVASSLRALILRIYAHVSLIWSSVCQFRRTRVRVMFSVILITGVSGALSYCIVTCHCAVS